MVFCQRIIARCSGESNLWKNHTERFKKHTERFANSCDMTVPNPCDTGKIALCKKKFPRHTAGGVIHQHTAGGVIRFVEIRSEDSVTPLKSVCHAENRFYGAEYGTVQHFS